jgi:YggT family protein
MELQYSLVAEIIFGLLILLLVARFFLSNLQSHKITLTEFVVRRATDWMAAPFAWLPRLRGYETAPLVSALLLCFAQDVIVLTLQGFKLFLQPQISLPVIGVRGVLYLCQRVIQLYTLIIIAGAICSWFEVRDPALRVTVLELYNRFMRPFRKLIPLIGNFDISPVVALMLALVVSRAIHETLATVSGIFQ